MQLPVGSTVTDCVCACAESNAVGCQAILGARMGRCCAPWLDYSLGLYRQGIFGFTKQVEKMRELQMSRDRINHGKTRPNSPKSVPRMRPTRAILCQDAKTRSELSRHLGYLEVSAES